MARVSIRTPDAALLEIGSIDDDKAAEIVEEMTVSFGKRGGLWMLAPADHFAPGVHGTALRWIPSTSSVVVAFDATGLPERARPHTLDARPSEHLRKHLT